MNPYWADTDAEAEEEMFRLLRDASVAEKFALTESLTLRAIALSRRALSRLHPEATEREILLRWVALHYGEELELELRDTFSPAGKRWA
jgi:hypothetical protein